jgi:hypothetical protein
MLLHHAHMTCSLDRPCTSNSSDNRSSVITLARLYTSTIPHPNHTAHAQPMQTRPASARMPAFKQRQQLCACCVRAQGSSCYNPLPAIQHHHTLNSRYSRNSIFVSPPLSSSKQLAAVYLPSMSPLDHIIHHRSLAPEHHAICMREARQLVVTCQLSTSYVDTQTKDRHNSTHVHMTSPNHASAAHHIQQPPT